MLFKMFFIAFSHQLVRSVAHLFGSSKPNLNNKITKQERKEMMKNCFSEGKVISILKVWKLNTQNYTHPHCLSLRIWFLIFSCLHTAKILLVHVYRLLKPDIFANRNWKSKQNRTLNWAYVGTLWECFRIFLFKEVYS